MNATYTIDLEISFEEYYKMLWRAAAMPIPKSSSSSMHSNVCTAVLAKGLESKTSKLFDEQFVYFARCAHIVDETQIHKGREPNEVKRKKNGAMLREAMVELELLRQPNSPLHALYKELVELLGRRREERERIIALQMKKDEEDAEVAKEREECERRREKLLQIEEAKVTPLFGGIQGQQPEASEEERQRQEYDRRRVRMLTEEDNMAHIRGQLGMLATPPFTSMGSFKQPIVVPPFVAPLPVVQPLFPAPLPLVQPPFVAPLPVVQPPFVEQQPVHRRPSVAPLPSQATEPLNAEQLLRATQPQLPQRAAVKPENPILFITAPTADVLRQRLSRWTCPAASTGIVDHRRGLVNLGNTCYLNSILQCLCEIPIGTYFATDSYIENIVDRYTGGGRIANSFAFIMSEIRAKGVTHAASPSLLKNAVARMDDRFSGFAQQDANELLRVLLDGIHENLNGASKAAPKRFTEIDNTSGKDADIALQYLQQYRARNQSIIADLMGFQERSLLLCPSCGHSSRSFGVVLSMDVPIPMLNRPVSIEDCIAAYCAPEVLDPQSATKCGKCTKTVQRTKQILFHSTPTVLVITLKRFRCLGNYSDKLNQEVFFGSKLQLNSRFALVPSANDVEYRLTGVVNHRGNMHGGHYTSDAVGADGRWFSFSDEVVRPCSAPDFSLAYILFYVKCS